MAVLQLVRTSDGTTSRIVPLPNPEQQDPDDLEKEGLDTVDVGSDLLLRFANNLVHSGFRLVDIVLVDRYFKELDDPQSDENIASKFDELLKLIVTDYEEARLYRQQQFPDLFVNDVRLRNLKTGNTVILGQEGVVHADLGEIDYLTPGLNA
jgi:hypothetical protein